MYHLYVLPVIGSVFSELDEYEFAESAAVVVGNGAGIAKRLR